MYWKQILFFKNKLLQKGRQALSDQCLIALNMIYLEVNSYSFRGIDFKFFPPFSVEVNSYIGKNLLLEVNSLRKKLAPIEADSFHFVRASTFRKVNRKYTCCLPL